MIQLNYRDGRPIYEQVRDEFRKLITAGALAADEKMPSVRSLAGTLSINPNTIQRAYELLEQEGYIYSVPGKGSFVAPDSDFRDKRASELYEKLLAAVSELRAIGVSDEDIIEKIKKGERE